METPFDSVVDFGECSIRFDGVAILPGVSDSQWLLVTEKTYRANVDGMCLWSCG